MTQDTPDTNVLTPRPHASGGVPTPRTVVERLVGTPVAFVALVVSLFTFITAGYLYVTRTALPPEWAAVGGVLAAAAFIIPRLSRGTSSVLRALPELSEVYLSKRYAQLATRIFLITIAAMVVLAALIALLNMDLVYGLVSQTTETIVVGGVAVCLGCSFMLVRALLSRAPPFDRSAVLTLVENSTLPEVLYGLALFGCPATIVAAMFLWDKPELFVLPYTIPTVGVLILVGGFTSVYAALIARA